MLISPASYCLISVLLLLGDREIHLPPSPTDSGVGMILVLTSLALHCDILLLPRRLEAQVAPGLC